MTHQTKNKYLYQVVWEKDGERRTLLIPQADVVAVTDRCNDLNQYARYAGHGQYYRVETVEAATPDDAWGDTWEDEFDNDPEGGGR